MRHSLVALQLKTNNTSAFRYQDKPLPTGQFESIVSWIIAFLIVIAMFFAIYRTLRPGINKQTIIQTFLIIIGAYLAKVAILALIGYLL